MSHRILTVKNPFICPYIKWCQSFDDGGVDLQVAFLNLGVGGYLFRSILWPEEKVRARQGEAVHFCLLNNGIRS